MVAYDKMKKVILKCLILIVPLAVVILFFEYNLRTMDNSYKIKTNNLETKLRNIEVINIGSSHANNAIVPDIIWPGKSYNLANSAQDFYYDFKLLEKYVDKMPNLKLVIIPVSYHSFEYRISNGFEPWRAYYYSVYCGINSDSLLIRSDIRNYSAFALWEPLKAVGYAMEGFKGEPVQLDEYGFMRVPPDSVEVIEKKINITTGKARVEEQHRFMKKDNVVYNEKILDKIMLLLKERQITPVFVTVPTYHTYYDNLQENKLSEMHKLISGYCSTYKVKYYDYYKDARFNITDFSNNDHLNMDGAKKFSKIIRKDIIEKLVIN
ncbi:hypothetical protein [Geobacter sp.]|uniref:hypothetical protein n=1 Tax=Geobacter sp. TaxID=46610 RepID=UPI0027BA214B|nr:hypothetical protein [Geobacter sp.]